MKDIGLSANLLEPLDCVSYRLRRAARMAAKSYDNALKPSGLRSTQFTLLAALDQTGEISIGGLSEALAIDGSTLTRNLEVLVRRGLVGNFGANDARVRKVRLTGPGKKAFKEAAPLWRAAQQKVLATLGPESWSVMTAQLHRIEAACDEGD